jgi:hypothetical protein
VKIVTTKYLPKNMGSLDRLVRAFVLAPAAISAAFGIGVSSIGATVLLVFASVFLATSATGRCPLSVPFGIDSHARTPIPH